MCIFFSELLRKLSLPGMTVAPIAAAAAAVVWGTACLFNEVNKIYDEFEQRTESISRQQDVHLKSKQVGGRLSGCCCNLRH